MADLYNQPKPPDEGEKKLPEWEVPPDQVRIQIRRRIIGGIVIMLVVLAAVIAFFLIDEERSQQAQDLHNMMPIDLVTNAATTAPTSAVPAAIAPVTVDEAWEKSMGPTAVEISPDKMAQAMGEIRVANDYLQVRDWDQSERHIRAALEIWPDMNAAMRMMGLIYIQRGQFDQAIVVLERALKSDPFNAETYNNLATAYMQKRMLDKAEDVYLTSLQIRPGYTIANLNLGLLYILWGRYDQAVDRLEMAIEQAPDNASALNNLGVALIRLGQYDEARQHLVKLVERDPSTAAPYFNVAITYVMEHDVENALAWIQRGADRCSPAMCHKFLSDSDFESIRNIPAFQKLVNDLYPDLPKGPQG